MVVFLLQGHVYSLCYSLLKKHTMEASSTWYHPSNEIVEILGLERTNNGRTCEMHECCGKEVVQLDRVVRLRRVQVVIDGREETAIAAHWITEGIERCRVGFLGKHTVKHWKRYDGKVAQVTEIYKDHESPTKRQKNHKCGGACEASILDVVYIPHAAENVGQRKKHKAG